MLNRVINILLKPTSEWQVISNEPSSVGRIFGGFAIPFSVLQAVAGVVALGVLGIGSDMMAQAGLSISMPAIIWRMVVGFVLSLVLLYALAYIGSLIAPSFNGNSDTVQALKLFTYSSTPTWLIGVVTPFFMGSPGLMILFGLLSFAAIGYAIYLIYIGAGPVMGITQDKLAGFTVVVIAIYIALGVVVYGVTSTLEKMALFG